MDEETGGGGRNTRLRDIGCLGVAWFLCAAPALAGTYYVAPDGKDDAPGTLGQPFASLQKGHDVAVAGDTVYLRGGTYAIKGPGADANSGILITKSGQSDSKRIYFWAYRNEIPKFDFAGLALGSVTGAGIRINGSSWLHFKGLEVCNVPQPARATNHGIWANPASNTIFERLNLHHNKGTGLFIAFGNGGNLVLNCDSHHNYDPGSSQGNGQNADGFGVHYQKSGLPTVLRGCRAWWNSDDGFDCINQGAPVVIENCWNSLNGYLPGTLTSAPSGNGNGFKIGGWGNPPVGFPAPVPQHTVRFCMAFMNKAAGFYQNHHPIANLYYNNTSFGNRSANYNMLGYDLGKAADTGMGIFRNNISFAGTAVSNAGGADASGNSWSIPGLAIAAADFASIDTAGMFGPRKEDGGLPDVKCMHLSKDSRLIDKGVQVGLAFEGREPDLGAFEYGLTTGVISRYPRRPGAVTGSGYSIAQTGAAVTRNGYAYPARGSGIVSALGQSAGMRRPGAYGEVVFRKIKPGETYLADPDPIRPLTGPEADSPE